MALIADFGSKLFRQLEKQVLLPEFFVATKGLELEGLTGSEEIDSDKWVIREVGNVIFMDWVVKA